MGHELQFFKIQHDLLAMFLKRVLKAYIIDIFDDSCVLAGHKRSGGKAGGYLRCDHSHHICMGISHHFQCELLT